MINVDKSLHPGKQDNNCWRGNTNCRFINSTEQVFNMQNNCYLTQFICLTITFILKSEYLL